MMKCTYNINFFHLLMNYTFKMQNVLLNDVDQKMPFVAKFQPEQCNCKHSFLITVFEKNKERTQATVQVITP